jgi:exodeoxyribonuclease VII small subunit
MPDTTYEEKVLLLEEILRRLDDSKTPIDELARDVRAGAALIRELDARLRAVESEVRDAFAELDRNGETTKS